MSIKVYCFDWAVYAERIMPAFARWLIDSDESSVYNLFTKTRCAQEEQFLPDPMQRLRIWPRAKAFVDAIPRGPHSCKEYAKLCSAEQFTALSDRYLHHYTPHLYQNSVALRSLWGAILEEYCLPQFPTSSNESEIAGMALETAADAEAIRGELVSLLHSAGLPELAREVGEQSGIERFDWEPAEEEDLTDNIDAGKAPLPFAKVDNTEVDTEVDMDENFDLYADEEEEVARPKGILIGSHPNTLHLRGWLASYSVRSMALFEYLVLGRRRMPFGYEAGEPLGCYSGYLLPDETWQLATSLRDAQPPSQSEAEDDYQRFVQLQTEASETPRLPDEVQPTYAHDFLKVVRRAALYNLGLICSVE